MLRKTMSLFIVVLGLLLLAACSPSGGEVAITPEVTLPAAPTAAATETAAAPTAAASTATAAPAETIPPQTPTATAASIDDFISQFKLAVAARDFTALQGMMTDPFTVGYWLSEGVELSPAEAATQLGSILPEGAQIVWADPDTDLAPLLQGCLLYTSPSPRD